MYIQVKTLPEQIQQLLALIGYMKKDILLETQEKVSAFSASSNGCRSFLAIINMFTNEHTIEYGSWGGSNMFNPENRVDNNVREYVIPPNFVIVKGEEGGGDPTRAKIIIRPDMMIPFLPAKKELNPRLQWIIDVLIGYTSAGRKAQFNEYGKVPPMEQEWVELETLGLIKRDKRGAVSLTTEGKNARLHRSGSEKYIAP